MSNPIGSRYQEAGALRSFRVPPPITVGQLTSELAKKPSEADVRTARTPINSSNPANAQPTKHVDVVRTASQLRGTSPNLRSQSPNLRAQSPTTAHNVPRAFAANVRQVTAKAVTPAARGAPKKNPQPTTKRMPSELELTKRDLEDVRSQLENLQRQMEADTEQMQTMVQEKEQVDTELATAKDQIFVLERQRNGLQEDLQQEKRLNNALQLSETTLKEEVQQLQRRVVAQQEENRLAQETSERRIAAITEAANKQMTEAEAFIASLQATIKDLQGTVEEQKATMVQMQKTKEAEQLTMDGILRDGERERMRLHNAMQEMKGNIRVYCRVRPLIAHDREYREMATHEAESRSLAARRASATVPGMQYISFPDRADHRCVTIAVPGGEGLTGGEKEMKDYQFQFDKVFEPSDSQDQVFEEIQQLVQSALDGYKVCIFAYGQTGSGKTYTMEGPSMQAIEKDPSLQGMIPRSVEQVFLYSQKMRERGWEYSLTASFVEIYNEQIRDLLNSSDAYQDCPETYDDGKCRHDIRIVDGYTVLTGVTEVPVTDARTVYSLLNIAMNNRKSSITAMNDRASRSHSVFTLKIVGTHEGSQQQVLGVLNLIDLAGSERVGLSGAQGDRLKEAAAINKSLSCLGDVIVALAKGDNHVPFRNSKLTHMLQPYMGNESKTLMFVNVSPSELFLSESLNSLRFAAKVNACEIGLAKRKVSFKK